MYIETALSSVLYKYMNMLVVFVIYVYDIHLWYKSPVILYQSELLITNLDP